jgi:hypothetical protein
MSKPTTNENDKQPDTTPRVLGKWTLPDNCRIVEGTGEKFALVDAADRTILDTVLRVGSHHAELARVAGSICDPPGSDPPSATSDSPAGFAGRAVFADTTRQKAPTARFAIPSPIPLPCSDKSTSDSRCLIWAANGVSVRCPAAARRTGRAHSRKKKTVDHRRGFGQSSGKYIELQASLKSSDGFMHRQFEK